MDKSVDRAEEDDAVAEQAEVPILPNADIPQRQPSNKISPAQACKHGRVIEDILTRGGKRTGKVRCLECGAIYDDPYRGLK